MKKLWLIALGVLFCCSITEAAPVKNSRSKKSDDIRRQKILDNQKKKRSAAVVTAKWHTDFTAALREARRSNKQILLLVTGSDWCPPCMNLEKKIFGHKNFVPEAAPSLVLLKADFPRKRVQSPQEKKQAAEIIKRYPVKSYPTVYLLNSNGRVLDKKVGFSGSGSPKSYLKSFKGYKTVKIKKK